MEIIDLQTGRNITVEVIMNLYKRPKDLSCLTTNTKCLIRLGKENGSTTFSTSRDYMVYIYREIFCVILLTLKTLGCLVYILT